VTRVLFRSEKMVNEVEVSRGEPCAAQKKPNRLPVFFIIDWRLLMNLS
jgi:hypothetical protein